MQFNYLPVVEATRGPIVESIHYGAFAVVDSNGRLIASYGDPYLVTYLRSSSKPMQVLPLVEMGGVEKYNITPRELSVMCASHSGTHDHANVVAGIQAKIGVTEDQLQCGVHAPMHEPTAMEMWKNDVPLTSNRHNCSGKHTGFLAHAMLRSLPTDDYLNPDHPIQQTIIKTFAEVCDMKVEDIYVGIDGCSAPVFGIPLYNAALGYARLCDPHSFDARRADACRKITHAMNTHPDMVGGPERFDTDLMSACPGTIISKGGAEGYQSVGILPGALGAGSPGIGICLKISDGDMTDRARTLTAVTILKELGALSAQQVEALAKYDTHPIRNWRKLNVGQLRPCFKFEKSA